MKVDGDVALPPNDTLQLEYVYGYNGRDGIANVHWNAEGKVVSHLAWPNLIRILMPVEIQCYFQSIYEFDS